MWGSRPSHWEHWGRRLHLKKMVQLDTFCFTLKKNLETTNTDFCKRVFFGDLLWHLLCELLFSFCTRTDVWYKPLFQFLYRTVTIIRTVNVKVNPWRRHVYRNLMYVRVSPKLGCVGGTGIHWVTRGTGTPKDRDEANRREFWVCDGWVYHPEAVGVSSMFI